MKKTFVYGLAAIMSLGAVAETTPLSAAERGDALPASVDRIRAEIRAESLTAMAFGEVQTVRHTRYHRRAKSRRYAKRRWCGYRRYYGRRCYYTPRVLRPFRQR